jgi:7,8-dihydro-6-hydroxymethylpterin-pyrophosphokinase
VLLPLLELDPDFVHPTTGESIRKMIKKLPPNPPVRKGGRFWY